MIPYGGEVPRTPSTWAWTTLDVVCDKIQDGTHFSPKTQLHSGRYRYITAKNIRPSGLDLSHVTYLERQVHRSIYARCDTRKGDVLLVKDGVNTGDAAINTLDEEISLLSSVCMLRPKRDILSGPFLRYFLLGPDGYRLLTGQMTGTAIKRIILRRIKETPVPIAPIPEQNRIVAEIERQLTRLDVAVAALKRVQANLKRYRASVLKAACEGRLVPTEAELARHEGRSYETGAQLLARILKERRTKWEADQLAKMQASGKPLKVDKWRSKYQEPVTSDAIDLGQLPEGWMRTSLSAIAELKGGITKGQRRRPDEKTRPVPYLRVANVQRGFLDLREVKKIQATEDEIGELKLRPGDILFNEGGDRDKLGRGWVWRGEIPECIHQNHVFRARICQAEVQSKFISWYGNSIGQDYFADEGKQTTNLASINLTRLAALQIPLPPSNEQRRIVSEVERRLSVAEENEAQVDASLHRAERLRQAILKRAFEGKLVPQDPTDEPASALLERIRAERASCEKAKGRFTGAPPAGRRKRVGKPS